MPTCSSANGIFSNDTATLRERVDERADASDRRPVDLVRGCPGVAGTVTASTDGAPAGSARTRLQASNPTVPDDSSSWGAYVPMIVVLVAPGGLGTWWFMRRRA